MKPQVMKPPVMRHLTHGFTLIELMVVVIVIGILGAIVYPNYADYVTRARRTEAAAGLTRAMQLAERHYSRTHSYAGVSYPLFSGENDGSSTHTLSAPAQCGALALNECVQIAAVPRQPDALCGTLILRSTGERLSQAAGDAGPVVREACWR